MAWPFSTPVAPSFDTGLMAVPDSLTVATASTVYLLGAVFCNPSASSITVTVTNTAGTELIGTMEVPAYLTISLSFAFLPCVGLKWDASTTGLKGQLWGYLFLFCLAATVCGWTA